MFGTRFHLPTAVYNHLWFWGQGNWHVMSFCLSFWHLPENHMERGKILRGAQPGTLPREYNLRRHQWTNLIQVSWTWGRCCPPALLSSPGEWEKESLLGCMLPEPRLLHVHGFMLLTRDACFQEIDWSCLLIGSSEGILFSVVCFSPQWSSTQH